MCDDEHRVEYEEVYRRTKSFKKTWQHAIRKYDCKLGYHVFRHHLRAHFDDVLQLSKEASNFRKEVLRDDIHEEIQMSKALKSNLQFLNDTLSKKKKQLQLLPIDAVDKEELKMVMDMVYKINQTIELMLKFSDKLEIETQNNPDVLLNKLMYCMEDFPLEYVEKFKERWDDYESGK